MTAPHSLTLVDGALAMDGGSVVLDAVDDTGRRRHLFLDWSLAAQRGHQTGLSVDRQPLRRGSPEEQAWIEAIASATVAPAGPPPARETIRPSPNRLVFAKDAEAVLSAGEHSPTAGLTALRDSLLEKIRSPLHTQNADFAPCPQCGCVEAHVPGVTDWMVRCAACGCVIAGANFAPQFPPGTIEFEKDYRVVFSLASVKQIPVVRALAPELSHFSSAEILNTARAQGMTLSVPSLSMGCAREYVRQAATVGIKAVIEEDKK